MIRYLTLRDSRRIHDRVLKHSGGSAGTLNPAGLESAAAQPRLTFGGNELYPTFADKAAALAFSLIENHPFVDGNKRVGTVAMGTFLLINGHEVEAPVDEQERVVLAVASGDMSRETFTAWVRAHIVPAKSAQSDSET